MTGQDHSSETRDQRFMRAALQEAARGRHTAHPNPAVGVVLVRGDELVATGFHERAGLAHAERVAFDAAGSAAAGSEVFVNLEPCSHYGRTPPCADAVIAAGVARVVVGMIDPNPQVSGRGIARIEAAGIPVDVGILESECWRENEAWVVSIREERPMVTVKLATSLDGRIATRERASRWITGPAARARVHAMRRESNAILVGTRTLLEDDPELTARIDGETLSPTPHRFVLDAALSLPDTARVLDVTPAATTILCGEEASVERQRALAARGVDVVEIPSRDGRLDLDAAVRHVGSRGYVSLLVEGGGELAGALFERRLVDRLVQFVAPLVLGGRDAVPAVGSVGVAAVDDAWRANAVDVERVGDDLMLTADFSPHLRPSRPPRAAPGLSHDGGEA